MEYIIDNINNIEVVVQFILQWYWLPLSIINIVAFVTILLENGKPEKTIAWLMVITFLPFIGVTLYYFFGQKFKKEKYFKKLDIAYSKKWNELWVQLKPFINKQIELTETYDKHLNDAFEYLVYTKNSIPTSNNNYSLLKNGEEKFPLLLEDIGKAKHHIHLEYYIFEDDNLGLEILDALVKKVNQGVVVRIIIDDFGSSSLAKKKKHYENLGLQFEIFLPVRFTSLANSNYRNHRKIIVIDGVIGYVGGINISEKYNNPNSAQLYWKDTSIRIIGDGVKTLQSQFWLHWQSISHRNYKLDKNYLPQLTEFYGNIPLTFAFSAPGKSPAYVMESMILSITSAQKSVLLCTPYFIPTEAFKIALLSTISKGVDVRLMIPKKGDSAIVQAASMSFLKPFMERGLKVYLYEKGFIHAKTICIDGILSYIGTTNLDSRSFDINFELSSILLNKELANELTNDFYKDIKYCSEYSVEKWLQKKWYYRVFASICRLFAPLL